MKNNIQVRLILLLGIMICSSNLMAEESQCVLVTSSESKIQNLTVLDVRKLYLGLNIDKKYGVKYPVLNASSDKTFNFFLKKIMRMSERNYEHKLIKNIFRKGTDKVNRYKIKSELVDHLKRNPGAVSFMDEKKARDELGLKIVMKLW